MESARRVGDGHDTHPGLVQIPRGTPTHRADALKRDGRVLGPPCQGRRHPQACLGHAVAADDVTEQQTARNGGGKARAHAAQRAFRVRRPPDGRVVRLTEPQLGEHLVDEVLRHPEVLGRHPVRVEPRPRRLVEPGQYATGARVLGIEVDPALRAADGKIERRRLRGHAPREVLDLG